MNASNISSFRDANRQISISKKKIRVKNSKYRKRLPPLWVFPYLGTIFIFMMAGSKSYEIAGFNLEHLFLGISLGLANLFLLHQLRFCKLDGFNGVFLYLILFFLSILFGLFSSLRPEQSPVGSATLLYWCGLTTSIGLGALAALCNQTLPVLGAIALSGLPVLLAILQPIFPSLSVIVPVEELYPLYMGRATGLFDNPNWTGSALYICFAACLCLYHFVRRRATRWACLVLSFVYAYGIFLTMSRASILVMVITACIFMLVCWRRTKKRWLVFCIIVLILLFGIHPLILRLQSSRITQTRLFDAELYGGDTISRLQGLLVAWNNLERLLVSGEGSEQFLELSHHYIGRSNKSPHNQILAIWVEWGFLALVLMYSAHAWAIWRGSRSLRRLRDTGIQMLLCVYVCILLSLQLHSTNSPPSCAMLGLFVGRAFQRQRG